MPVPTIPAAPIPVPIPCEATDTGWVVLSGARMGEGEGVGRRETPGEPEGVWVWEGVSEGVPGVLDVLGPSVREVRCVRASCLERLRMMSDFMLIGRAEPWSL